MASGETMLMWGAVAAEFPATDPAVPGVRNNHPTVEFDNTTMWTCYFTGVMPRTYSGGGLATTVVWMAKTATTGALVWGTSFERMNTDLDSDSFGTEQDNTGSANGTSGIPTSTTMSHSSSEVDGVTAGDPVRLRIRRLVADTDDVMSGFAQLLTVEVRET